MGDQAHHHTHALIPSSPTQDSWVLSPKDPRILGSACETSQPLWRVEARTLGPRGHMGKVRVRKSKPVDPQRPSPTA